MGALIVSQAAIALAKRFEGFHGVSKNDAQRRAHPYICPAGFWTIGYGHLGAGRLQTSTLRRRINQRDWDSAAHELRRWTYGGGKVLLPGLVTRREAEVVLLL